MLHAYEARVKDALRLALPNGNNNVLPHSLVDAKEALRRIRLAQASLRLIKKDLIANKRDIQSSATINKAKVGSGLGAVITTLAFGSRATRRVNSLTRASIRQRELHAIQPYLDSIREIDQHLFELDTFKVRVESWMSEQGK